MAACSELQHNRTNASGFLSGPRLFPFGRQWLWDYLPHCAHQGSFRRAPAAGSQIHWLVLSKPQRHVTSLTSRDRKSCPSGPFLQAFPLSPYLMGVRCQSDADAKSIPVSEASFQPGVRTVVCPPYRSTFRSIVCTVGCRCVCHFQMSCCDSVSYMVGSS